MRTAKDANLYAIEWQILTEPIESGALMVSTVLAYSLDEAKQLWFAWSKENLRKTTAPFVPPLRLHNFKIYPAPDGSVVDYAGKPK